MKTILERITNKVRVDTTGLKNNACVLYAVDEIGNVWEYTPADGWHVLEMTRIIS